MSLEAPPKPFVDSGGGDEWYLCLRGGDIARLVEKFKDDSLESFPDLQTAEFIETTFHTAKDIERLNNLEQLSCYFNRSAEC